MSNEQTGGDIPQPVQSETILQTRVGRRTILRGLGLGLGLVGISPLIAACDILPDNQARQAARVAGTSADEANKAAKGAESRVSAAATAGKQDLDSGISSLRGDIEKLKAVTPAPAADPKKIGEEVGKAVGSELDKRGLIPRSPEPTATATARTTATPTREATVTPTATATATRTQESTRTAEPTRAQALEAQPAASSEKAGKLELPANLNVKLLNKDGNVQSLDYFKDQNKNPRLTPDEAMLEKRGTVFDWIYDKEANVAPNWGGAFPWYTTFAVLPETQGAHLITDGNKGTIWIENDDNVSGSMMVLGVLTDPGHIKEFQFGTVDGGKRRATPDTKIGIWIKGKPGMKVAVYDLANGGKMATDAEGKPLIHTINEAGDGAVILPDKGYGFLGIAFLVEGVAVAPPKTNYQTHIGIGPDDKRLVGKEPYILDASHLGK